MSPDSSRDCRSSWKMRSEASPDPFECRKLLMYARREEGVGKEFSSETVFRRFAYSVVELGVSSCALRYRSMEQTVHRQLRDPGMMVPPDLRSGRRASFARAQTERYRHRRGPYRQLECGFALLRLRGVSSTVKKCRGKFSDD
jgi:hypothetical protein